MYKVRVITIDGFELEKCSIKVAVRLINNGRATVIKMVNDNGTSKVSIIQLNKTHSEATSKKGVE